MLMTRRALIVDRDAAPLGWLVPLLVAEGFEAVRLPEGASALAQALREPVALAVVAILCDDAGGLELLGALRRIDPAPRLLAVLDREDDRQALAALQAGADDVVPAREAPDLVGPLARRLDELARLNIACAELRRRLNGERRLHDLVAKSPPMQRAVAAIPHYAALADPVLIQGEPGTGRSSLAYALHAAGPRRDRPFGAIACAGLDARVLQAELFGASSSGRPRSPLLERLDGGTLLLANVSDLAEPVQARLLRLIESGTYEHRGAARRADVRLVATSDGRLGPLVQARRFRADLFRRLDALRLDLPPLRQRKVEIPALCAHFLERFRHRSTPPVVGVAPEAMRALFAHDWPGNVAELETVIGSAVGLADGPSIRPNALPAAVAAAALSASRAAADIDFDRPLAEVVADVTGRAERAYLSDLLVRHGGRIAPCARDSGLSRQSILNKLRKHNIDPDDFRRGDAAAQVRSASLPGGG
jgi:DNA-binding NtrC family response regulator